MGYEMDLIVPNPKLNLLEGAVAPWRTVKNSKYLRDLVKNNDNRILLNVPFKDLSDAQVKLLKEGFKGFVGINGFFKHLEEKNYKMGIRILLSKYRGYTTCAACVVRACAVNLFKCWLMKNQFTILFRCQLSVR